MTTPQVEEPQPLTPFPKTIIDGLKELPLIEKKISKKLALLQQYAAVVDNGNPDYPCGGLEEQKIEVAALQQGIKDLVHHAAWVKRALAYTNLTTIVKIMGFTSSITEWIYMRDKGIRLLINSLEMLTDQEAKKQLREVPFDPEKGVKIVRCYDEKTKNAEIERLQELQTAITAALEVANATTTLCVPPYSGCSGEQGAVKIIKVKE